ncbi:MAG: hypothetical protein HY660_10200 [Armatimonadetes bacterium]|nr:hypothetical protein [Armatimonadota bacterium]
MRLRTSRRLMLTAVPLVLAVTAAVLSGPVIPPADAQPRAQRIAVAGFFNEVATYGEADLLLPGILTAAVRDVTAGRWEIVDARLVREEMARRRWTSRDLFSLTHTTELGRALGADVVVTAWIAYFDAGVSSEGTETGSDRPKGMRGPLEVKAAIRVRAMEVATRKVLQDGEFSGVSFGLLRDQGIRQALADAARKAARALLGS